MALLTAAMLATPALAADLTIREGGKVVIELTGSEALFSNTLALTGVTRPDGSRAIADVMRNEQGHVVTGCTQIEANDLTTVLPLASGKKSRIGCRVTLDADSSTRAIDPFPAGTTFRFAMCAQTDPSPECEHVWHSDASRNPDRFDHVLTQERNSGLIYQLGWEDSPNGGDRDFNDIVVNVRIAADRDADGLWDDWETDGIDLDSDGVIDVDLRSYDEEESRKAEPDRKDIFVWIDYMGCSDSSPNCATGHTHRPSKEVLDDVIEAFKNAPVENPDGSKGINLHLVLGNEIPHQDHVFFGCQPDPPVAVSDSVPRFDDLKRQHFGDSNPTRAAFRYALIGHSQQPGFGSSGCGEINGNDFLMTLGTSTDRKWLAGTFMHELGHNLGLGHGGGDGENNKPNYMSVMNYRYQFDHIPFRLTVDLLRDGMSDQPQMQPADRVVLDYSRLAFPDLNEDSLDEDRYYEVPRRDEEFITVRDGNAVEVYRRRESFRPQRNCRGRWQEFLGNAQVDWNCDGRTGGMVSYDVNQDGRQTILRGFNDWANILYDFQNHHQYEDGVRSELPVELTVEEAARQQESLNRVPVAVIAPMDAPVATRQFQLDGSQSSDPDGGTLTYEWRVVGRSAAIARADAATPIVQFGGGYGEYVFELTVTDAGGATSTARVTILYVGR